MAPRNDTDTRVARFFVVQYTKTWKIYQMTTKYTKIPYNTYTKWPENLPNDHRIYYNLQWQEPSKYTQIGILGLKINHLANPDRHKENEGKGCPKKCQHTHLSTPAARASTT
jgi:hypothetical protein